MPNLFLPHVVFEPRNIKDKKLAYQTKESACFDLYSDADSTFVLQPGQRCMFPTGVYLKPKASEEQDLGFNSDYINAVLLLRSKSGLCLKHGIIVIGGEVDCDFLYPNEIKVLLLNMGQDHVAFSPGDKIAQARWSITMRATGVEILDVERHSGFGSTGK